MGAIFKKDDLVIFDNGKEKIQGVVAWVDGNKNRPIRVMFKNGSTRSYTLDGRACKSTSITLFLDPKENQDTVEKEDKTPKFEKGDLVVRQRNSLGYIDKGLVVEVKEYGEYPVIVEFENGSSGTFSKEGKQYKNQDIVLFLEEIKTKAVQEVVFKVGDPVTWIDDNSTKNGFVQDVCKSHKYPIIVDFDGNTQSFTKDGRFVDSLVIVLFHRDIKPIFKKGDDVVYQESEGTLRHGVVYYVDEDGRSFPVEVKFNGYRNRNISRKLSFTEDGRYTINGDQKLFLTKDHKLFKMKEASKKVKKIKESLKESEDSKKEYDHVSAPHYRQSPIEAIDIFEKVYGAEMTAMWCEITALKYRLRLGHKPTSLVEDDLKKEKWYLDKREELLNKIPQPVN